MIAQHQGRSDEPRTWRWTMHLHAGGHTNGLTGLDGEQLSRETAMVAFSAAWERIRLAIGDEGWRLHVEHMQWSAAQAARGHRQRQGTEPGGYG